MEACLKMIHSKSLPLAGMEVEEEGEERMEVQNPGFYFFERHIERKKYPIFSNLEGKERKDCARVTGRSPESPV